jgi:AraC-like DNA-binding protein
MSTASVQIVRLVLAACTVRGISVTEFLSAIGLEPHQVLDPDGRVPSSVAQRAWHVAAERCADPHFGLSVAELVQPRDIGALGYAMCSSATLGEALRRLSSFFRLFHQQASLALIEERDVVRIRILHEIQDPMRLRHPVECLMARLIDGARVTTGRRVPIVALSFRHPSPADTSAHVRAFGCVPSFGQAHNEAVVPRDALDTPQRTSAPLAAQSMERHLQKLLDELPAEEKLIGRARRVLAEEMRRGEPSLEAVAKRLGMSGRTLQRKLREEGMAFQALLDDLRCELARRHMDEPQESIAEIAFLLGFSEVSTFHRAFKRWTGHTPGEYRKRIRER